MSDRKTENNRHTITDLYQMQSLSLSSKVRMTQRRIEAWVDEYGVDGVYVSFSGGKDSTVLLHLVRDLYPDVKAVFVDTGLEYPEIRDFVKTFDNVEWLKPKLTFRQVIEKYGYPFISKEVSECVYGARRYLDNLIKNSDGGGGLWGIHSLKKLYGIGEYEKQPSGVDIADNSNLLELADNVCQNPNSGGGLFKIPKTFRTKLHPTRENIKSSSTN